MNQYRPILFNTEMVRAILEGKKTVTRRVVKPQPEGQPTKMGMDSCWPGYFAIQETPNVIRPPYQPGDILWVRETWGTASDLLGGIPGPTYRADYSDTELRTLRDKHYIWSPSIHMPREAARIFLRVKEVTVERLQDCGNAQAKDEGCTCCSQFARVWDSTLKPADRGHYGWEANPWVWVIRFERCCRPALWP